VRGRLGRPLTRNGHFHGLDARSRLHLRRSRDIPFLDEIEMHKNASRASVRPTWQPANKGLTIFSTSNYMGEKNAAGIVYIAGDGAITTGEFQPDFTVVPRENAVYVDAPVPPIGGSFPSSRVSRRFAREGIEPGRRKGEAARGVAAQEELHQGPRALEASVKRRPEGAARGGAARGGGVREGGQWGAVRLS
jgi:hypothetical protein